jgi:ParB-like chromosome segregation protein Spo0J
VEQGRSDNAGQLAPAPPPVALAAAARILISHLSLSDSPRLAGESSDHVRLLAESGARLPAIIVQRGTNRVIDGAHRVRAAQLRGEDTVEVRFFDGDDKEAFVLAVRANIEHGLLLSLADRKAAATRILQDHPQWSNRRIAPIVGLSAKTIGALRKRVDLGNSPDESRIGQDGRVRPLDAHSGRQRASEILTQTPGASLRAVAAAAGISVGTVRSVRNRLRRESPPGPAERGAPAAGKSPDALCRPISVIRGRSHRGVPDREPTAVLRDLCKDPSLRFSESGRLLLNMLRVSAAGEQTRDRLVTDIPEHCLSLVTYLAMRSATMWQEIVVGLEQRINAGLDAA